MSGGLALGFVLQQQLLRQAGVREPSQPSKLHQSNLLDAGVSRKGPTADYAALPKPTP